MGKTSSWIALYMFQSKVNSFSIQHVLMPIIFAKEYFLSNQKTSSNKMSDPCVFISYNNDNNGDCK